MNYQWNTRKFEGITRQRLINALVKIGGADQVLVIQPKLLAVVNKLVTFTELSSKTNVKKILVLDENVASDLADLLSATSESRVIALLDVRVDLTLPSEIEKMCNACSLQDITILHSSWDFEVADSMQHIPHFIESQVHPFCKDVTVVPWAMVPSPLFDDDFLCAQVLYNSSGESMYRPPENHLKTATRNILVDNMLNCVQTLLTLTNTTITNSVTLGNLSKEFANTLKTRIENNRTEDDDVVFESLHGRKGNIDIETDLIVIEREMDPITPLLTELTYLGVLNDIFQFDNIGKLKGKDTAMDSFASDDDVWNQLKFLNFGAMGPMLNKMAKDLQAKYDSRHDAETVGQIKTFVDSLGSLQQEQKLLKVHTTLSSDILETVEGNDELAFNVILELEQDILLDNLGSTVAVERILTLMYEGDVGCAAIIRLVCLLSLCKNGLKDNDFDTFKKELIDTFGIEVCFTLETLTRNGMFVSKSLMQSRILSDPAGFSPIMLKKEYRHISKWFNTLPSDELDASQQQTDMMNPREPTFAYCGVAPLSVRLIQSLYDRTVLAKNYSSQQPFMMSREPSCLQLQELSQQLYGQSDVISGSRWVPEPTDRLKRVRAATQNKAKGAAAAPVDRDIVLVVCLGGIAPGELALLKFLQRQLQQRNIHKRLVIIADGLLQRPGQ